MNEPRKLHKSYILFPVLKGLQTLIPVLVLISAREGEWRWIPFLILLGVCAMFAGFGAVGWSTFSYRLEKDRLVIQKGLIFREEKMLYYPKIHSMNTEQPLVQRLLGVVQLKLEMPGGKGESDGVLPAVSAQEAAAIIGEINAFLSSSGYAPLAAENGEGTGGTEKAAAPSAGSAGKENTQPLPASAEAEGVYAYRASAGTLILAAFSTLNIGLIAAFVAGVMSLADDLLPGNVYERLWNARNELNGGWLVYVLLGLGGLAAAWLLAGLLYLLKYAGFSVRAHAGTLTVSYGLLEKKKHTFQEARVQAVLIKEGLVRQLLGRAQIELRVVSSSKEEKIMLMPLMSAKRIPELLPILLPRFSLPEIESRPPARALLYYSRTDGVIVAVLAAAAVYVWGTAALWGLLLLLLDFVWSYSRFRSSGMTLHENQLTVRSRMVARSTWLVRRPQILSLRLKGTSSQRRKHLLSLSVSVMGDTAAAACEVSFIEERDAQRVWSWFSRSTDHAHVKD
ncbi:PH domain-containing protein [Paenibacillus sp. UNC499MF]|uniref:PH domain-containing protein n=1 Tax=Paenibacillus sp. UNC499MF TaxID=1502751 RepID=UPI0008A0012B|nr:PH domain-containing protein [Paenibacillus sp. UNC499MF]SEG66151.1 putative membrane protein [Paenibacillus sp. UNC499MF]